jgi:hypothetical protein
MKGTKDPLWVRKNLKILNLADVTDEKVFLSSVIYFGRSSEEKQCKTGGQVLSLGLILLNMEHTLMLGIWKRFWAGRLL